ncbi:MAG: aldehyde dehydrogenase family protein, partial [Priestia megaterium]
METTTNTKVIQNYIAGEWVESSTRIREKVYNPATGEVIAEVPLSTKEDVDQAVRAANEAFKGWSKTAVPKRARILFKYQQLLVDNWDELARLVTIENGKSFNEAHGEVQRGIECVEFAAGAPTLM